jgi:hypothetical protein
VSASVCGSTGSVSGREETDLRRTEVVQRVEYKVERLEVVDVKLCVLCVPRSDQPQGTIVESLENGP